MTLVSGASQFVNQATLAVRNGGGFSAPNVLADAGIGGILEVGRGNAVPGVGVSSSARALNRAQLSRSSADFNNLFSLTGGTDGTIAGAQTAINAIRASIPDDQLHSSVRGTFIDTDA